VGLDQRERFLAVLRDLYFVSALLQQELDCRDDVRFIVGNRIFCSRSCSGPD
jgi:hypothetical protein